MNDKEIIINNQNIQNKIYTVRGLQVMLDSDLAELYEVETKVFNQAVKRNLARFPGRFRFQLTEEEYENLRSKIATSNGDNSLRSQFVTLKNYRGKHRKYLPYVFTEHGVSMLSSVLKSDIAIKISIQIIDSFISMRKFISNNAMIFQRFEQIEKKQLVTDSKIDQIFKAIESKEMNPKQGIFYDGEIFDAYVFVSNLIKTAKKSIILIDNYIDENLLQLLSKSNKNCNITIYTDKPWRVSDLDLEKFKEQYKQTIELKPFKKSHDRFLILDNKEIYHFGASLKDLGNKWFAFSKMDSSFRKSVLDRLKV